MERFAIQILHQQIQNICRLCGVDNPVKKPIVEDDEVICVDDDEVTLVKKIEECVGIRVYKTDRMPQQICSLCVDKVNDFYEYRSMCAATNIQTRTILNLPLVEPTSILIKTEPTPEPPPAEESTAPIENKAGVKRLAKTRNRKNDNADTSDLPGASSEKRIKTEYACQYCNDAYDTSSDLERHLVVKHTPLIRKYGCGTCAELFDTATEYKDHNKWHKHSRIAYYCYRCKRKFLKSTTLDKHLEMNACVRGVRKPTTTTLIPDMQCRLCFKTFKTHNLYEWHSCFLRARANCPKCGKYFLKKNLLIKHYILYCTGTLAPMEPMMVKEESEAAGSNGVPERTSMPETTGKVAKKRGRPRIRPPSEEMKEETTELPFPPLLDTPEMKLESTCSEVTNSQGNVALDADVGGDNRKRPRVTFKEEEKKINTLLRSGEGVDENSGFAEISSILTSMDEAIATISGVRKKKKHKDPATSNTVENNTPMEELSMANVMAESCNTPGTAQTSAAPLEESENNDANPVSTNRETHEEIEGNACNDLEEGFAGYDDNDSIDNMEGGGSDHETEESSTTASAIHDEAASKDTSDASEQMASPLVQVKQEPMTSEADAVGGYEAAMSCLAIKHEPVHEEYMQTTLDAVDPPHRRERRTTQNTSSLQTLRMRIKKEKGLHNATVVEEESIPIQIPPVPDGSPARGSSITRQQKKPAKKPTTPNHYKVRPMRSRPTAPVEPEVHIKQERLESEEHQLHEEHEDEAHEDEAHENESHENEAHEIEAHEIEAHESEEHENEDSLQNADEEYNRVAIKQEPLDGLPAHSNLDQPVPTRSSVESHADGNNETETAFYGVQIKQERECDESTSVAIWPTVRSNGATDEPLSAAGSSQAGLTQAENRLSNVNEAGSSRSGSRSKKLGKSSRRINPFALLHRKTLAAASALEPAPNERPSAERLSLPIIAQITSGDLGKHVAEEMDSSSFEAQVEDSNDGTIQANDLNDGEPDKEAPVPSTVPAESSIADTEPATEKIPVENVITQRDATELRIVSVSTVQENAALTEESGCTASEKAAIYTESDSKSVGNDITSKDQDSTMRSVVDSQATECISVDVRKIDTETILPKEQNQEVCSDEDKSDCSPRSTEEASEKSDKQVPEEENELTEKEINRSKDVKDDGGTSKVLSSEEGTLKVLPAKTADETAEKADELVQTVDKDAAKEAAQEEIHCVSDVMDEGGTSKVLPSEEGTSKVLPAKTADETTEKADELVQAVDKDAAKEAAQEEIHCVSDVMDEGGTSKVLPSEEGIPKEMPVQSTEENTENDDERLQEVDNDASKEPAEEATTCATDVNDEGSSKVLPSVEGTPKVLTAEGHDNTGQENEKT